jgi:hypothetical protein
MTHRCRISSTVIFGIYVSACDITYILALAPLSVGAGVPCVCMKLLSFDKVVAQPQLRVELVAAGIPAVWVEILDDGLPNTLPLVVQITEHGETNEKAEFTPDGTMTVEIGAPDDADEELIASVVDAHMPGSPSDAIAKAMDEAAVAGARAAREQFEGRDA